MTLTYHPQKSADLWQTSSRPSEAWTGTCPSHRCRRLRGGAGPPGGWRDAQPERGNAAEPPGEGGHLQGVAQPQVFASAVRGGRRERRNWEESGCERSLAGKSAGRRKDERWNDFKITRPSPVALTQLSLWPWYDLCLSDFAHIYFLNNYATLKLESLC